MQIAFIGGGNMGEAILAAVLANNLAAPAGISVSDVSADRCSYLKDKYGVAVTVSNPEAAAGKGIIILAIKPQQLADVMAGLKGSLEPEQLVVSIIAGATIKTISQGLGHDCIVRAMPNTPAQVGQGMTAWTATPAVTPVQKEGAAAIFRAMGKEIYFPDEKYLDMATAISGSGPAYFFMLAEQMAAAAVDIGIDEKAAAAMVMQTMLGAAKLLEQSNEPAAELRRRVTSPGGTTAAAIGVFESGGLADLVGQAVKAAYDRARELGG